MTKLQSIAKGSRRLVAKVLAAALEAVRRHRTPSSVYDNERDMRLSDRVHSWGIYVCIACIIAMSIWVNSISDHVSNVGTAQATEQGALNREAAKLASDRTSLIEGCQRLNQLRASDNVAHLGNFILFESVIGLSKLPPQQPETAQQRSVGKAFLVKLERAAKAQSWTPMSDCQQTIQQQGANYQLPPPVSFETHLPPSSALALPKR